MTRVLAATVAREKENILRAHHESKVRAAYHASTDVDVDFVYMADMEQSDPAFQFLVEETDANVIQANPDERPDGSYLVDEDTHHWDERGFQWIGMLKQQLLNLAREKDYDKVWLVDSDLVVGPQTLRSLLSTDRDVVSAVFWTSWSKGIDKLPQVWLQHPYELSGRGMSQAEFLRKLSDRQLVEVGGLGACTLVDTSVLDEVLYYPPLQDVPDEGLWKGEDRHFCERAKRARISLWADAWPDVWHCYRPSQESDLNDRIYDLQSRTKPTASFGDFVSFEVTPLEEPDEFGTRRFRGRLGVLDLLPELEETLGEMETGSEAIVRLHYPVWWRLSEYRGESRTVQVKLHGVKPPNRHPSLKTERRVDYSDRFYTPDQLTQMREVEVESVG